MTPAARRLLCATRRRARLCIDCGARLRRDDGVRCARHAARASKAALAWQRRNRARRAEAERRRYHARRLRALNDRIALEIRLLDKARYACKHKAPDGRARFVSLEYDRLRARVGLPALVPNQPPPGWSVEADRREELLAISEHVALRRVS